MKSKSRKRIKRKRKIKIKIKIKSRHFLRTAVFSAKTADSLVRHARTGTGTWRSGGLPGRSISTRFQALTYVVRQVRHM